MRVLRPRGPDPADRHHQSRSRPPEPGPRDQGRPADDVRRPDEPSAEVAAEVRRHLGRAGLRDGRPAQRPAVRGAELRPADRPVPAGLEGRRGVRARSPPNSSRGRTVERRASPEPQRPSRQSRVRAVASTRHDRPTRPPAGPRARPRRAHPAAHAPTTRPRRDPARADPAEPAPAAAADGRGGARGRSPRASASTASSSRSS